MALKDKLSDLKSKVKQDAKRADRMVLDVDRKQKLKAAASKGRAAAIRARDATAERVPDDLEIETETVSDRARKAGEARAPVDATLDVAGTPRSIEAMTVAAGQTDPFGGSGGQADAESDGMGAGMSDVSAAGSRSRDVPELAAGVGFDPRGTGDTLEQPAGWFGGSDSDADGADLMFDDSFNAAAGIDDNRGWF